MDLKTKNLDLDNITKEENKTNKNNCNDYKNKDNNSEEDAYFYIMTLQADGQRRQIKIYENSNASELAFNFCKTYNLDFATMKYLKKCIKQIILHFNNTKKNEMIYLLKDNSSIQEVAEEEIITDNSLKKSGTIKKNNSNNLNAGGKDSKIETNFSKENIMSLLSDQQSNSNKQKSNNKSNNNNSNTKLENKNLNKKFEEKAKEKRKSKNNEKEKSKSKNTIEDEGQIELKDYSIDYCLENESVEIFPPTEHTTKIEQKSSIKNSYSLNQKKNSDLKEKKKNSKNKKLQLNSNGINYNRINKKQNCLFNLNKTKKEKSKNNDINNTDLKNILIQYKDINIKEKSRSKTKSKSKSKSKSKEKKFEYDKEKLFIKKNNYMQYNNNNNINKKQKSLEKLKKRINNKTTFIDNKKQEISKQLKNNTKINKHEKIITNMNDIKNKYFSNYYDYFIKTKNLMLKNNMIHKYQTSSSINQDSIRSKSISQHKVNQNLTQKLSKRKKAKKEKSMMHLNVINHQKMNNTSKINLNTILKKDSFSKDKQRTVFKNKIKPKYNIICNKANNNLFNKTLNGQCLTFRTKLKNVNGKELFMESKNINSNGIRKMVTESLINIYKFKDPSKDKKKKNIFINDGIIKGYNNSKNKNSRNKDIFLKNDTNIEKSINFQDQLYFESGNNNNNINNNITMKTKRNITESNLMHKKIIIKKEVKKNT